MPSNQAYLYHQAYQQFMYDILSGKVVKGQFLPSIKTISKDIGLSKNTVLAALALLQQDGYVKPIPKKGIVVIRDTLSDDHFKTYILERRKTIDEVISTICFLTKNLMVYGAGLCGEAEFDQARAVINSMDRASLSPREYQKLCSQFCQCLIAPTQNTLFQSLIDSAIHFIGFFMIHTYSQTDLHDTRRLAHQAMSQILNAAESRDAAALRTRLDQDFSRWCKKMSAALSEQVAAFTTPDEVLPEHAAFSWYPNKSTRLRHLAAVNEIMHSISLGYYPYGSFIPSQSVLQKELGIAPTSLQNTMNILKGLGLLTYVNGRGYAVSTGTDVSPVQANTGQDDYMLLFHRALQIWLLTYRDMIAEAFPYLGDGDIAFFLRTDAALYGTPAGKFYSPSQLMLSIIVDKIPNQTLKSVYQRMERMLSYGCRDRVYPLESREQIVRISHDYILEAVQCIRQGDQKGFSEKIGSMLYNVVKITRLVSSRDHTETLFPPMPKG